MYYGWKLNPVQYDVTTPETLRIDFITDYVLMVAEAYHAEGDKDLAARRLALISTDEPLAEVTKVIKEAEQSRYPSGDLVLMRELETALKDWNPLPVKAKP